MCVGGVGGGRGLEAIWRCTVVLDDVGVCVEGVGVGLEAVWRCTVVVDDVGAGGEGGGA